MKAILALILFALAPIAGVYAAPATGQPPATDQIATVLVDAGSKPITADTLPSDFARLAHFVRHEGNGMVLFTDSAPADGHVRNAQAHFSVPNKSGVLDSGLPLFAVAFELAEEPDFTFDGLAAAIERKLGAPTAHSNRTGAVFRTWLMKAPVGRSFTIAKAQASDNGDPITIVQLVQNQ